MPQDLFSFGAGVVMARRRQMLSSLCFSASVPKNPNKFRLKFFYCLLWFLPYFFPLVLHVVCNSGGFSSLKIIGSHTRWAPPPFGRTSSYFAAGFGSLFSLCRLNRLNGVLHVVVVFSTSQHKGLYSLMSFVNRRWRLPSASVNIAQISTVQSLGKVSNWVWPIFGPSRVCGSLLSFLVCKFVLFCRLLGFTLVLGFLHHLHPPPAQDSPVLFFAFPSISHAPSLFGPPNIASGSVSLRWILLH